MSDNYPHGLFSWVDLSTPDPVGAKTFYTTVFGWAADDQLDGDGNLIYTLLRQDGEQVAGLGPLQQEGMPSVWTSYVNVDDADAVVAKVADAGGQVLVPPMDVMDTGRMAIVVDPGGAAVGLWQPGLHTGAELFGAHGALSWNELVTRDVEEAKAFYSTILPWTFSPSPASATEYWLIELDTKVPGLGLADDNLNGGIMPMDDEFPSEVPSHWAVYFTVEDTDDAVTAAQTAGGMILRDPFVTPVGKIGIVADPYGATFSVIAPSQAA